MWKAAHTLAHLFWGVGGDAIVIVFRHLQYTQSAAAGISPATVFSGPVIYCNVLIGVYLARRPESASDEQPGTVVFPGATAPDEKERGKEKKTPEPLLFVLPFVHSAPCNFSTHAKIVHCAFGNLQRLP